MLIFSRQQHIDEEMLKTTVFEWKVETEKELGECTETLTEAKVMGLQSANYLVFTV